MWLTVAVNKVLECREYTELIKYRAIHGDHEGTFHMANTATFNAIHPHVHFSSTD